MTTSGLVIVDKPAGLTSHDVVARIRRLAVTRRVGHAGTLDPMATGVLVVGIEKATRLLGHLTLTEKEYAATIRLGQATTTDDADGELVTLASAAGVCAGALAAALTALTGQISQVPPPVSAIKVNGKRAYALTRAGAAPDLAARTVTISRLDLLAVRPDGELLDLDVQVVCSSGTYIRAIARDLGAALGTGGHLTALRRTRVGPYPVEQARTLEQLAAEFEYIPLAEAAAAAFRRRDLTEDEARAVSHGGRLATASGQEAQGGAPGGSEARGPGGTRGGSDAPVAAFAPDGSLIALLAEQDGAARPSAVFGP